MSSAIKKDISLTTHLSVIISLLLFTGLPLTWQVKFPVEFWIQQFFMFLLWLAVFYANLYLLVPKLLYNGRSGLFITSMIVVIAGVLILTHTTDNLLHLHQKMEHFFHKDTHPHKDDYSPIGDFIQVIVVLVLLAISTTIKVGRKMQSDNAIKQTLEQEKINTELSFLKAQINPHFFFNVLHSIYALIEVDVTAGRDALYTLSHMMRYVLFNTSNQHTTLSKEIAFIDDYVKLMRLRLNSNVEVIFNKPVNAKDLPITPMLFLPFVENVFKHGVAANQPSKIYISITETDGTLQIETRNTVFDKKAENMEASNRIGLTNTRRRLDLLYPGKFNLQVDPKTAENEFVVKLKLNLV